MERSGIILAGGFSKRSGQDKGLIKLAGKPLILHVLDRTSGLVNEIVVVVSSGIQKRGFERMLQGRANVIVDEYKEQSPLVGALTGFREAQGRYSLLLPCDTPFVSNQVAALLLDLCVSRNAAISRWPNGYIEPLQAVYNTKSALKAAKTALEEKKSDMRSMVLHMTKVRYISTMVIQRLDPELLTFFNINTPEDLKRAEGILKRRNPYSNSKATSFF